eukprot:8941068-Pyramimonas_sp.AAC.1
MDPSRYLYDHASGAKEARGNQRLTQSISRSLSLRSHPFTSDLLPVAAPNVSAGRAGRFA